MLTIEFYLLSKPVTPIEDGADIFFIERVLKALPVLRIALQRYSHRGTRGNSDASAKIVKILLTQKYFLLLPKIANQNE